MSYSPAGILFDGTNDFLRRGSGLTGIADGKLGLLSFWFRIDGGDGTEMRTIGTSASRFFCFRLTTGFFRISASNSVGGAVLTQDTSTAHTSSSVWKHYLASWNLGTDISRVYIDDANNTGGQILVDDLIDYTTVDWSVGAANFGTQKYFGALSDMYFSPEFMDLDVEANRRKFIDANGRAVFLGSAGELPTGTPAAIYLRGNEVDQGLNSGTGGDFVSQATQTAGETQGPFGPGTLPGGVAGMLQLSRRAGRFHRFFRG